MNKNKGILYAGLLTFISLFVLSIIYYKERIIFSDPAFQLSYMIRDGGFAIQVNRFAALITKIFPFIAIKLSLPLNFIALLYSISFPIYNFILFIIILKGFNSLKWALILLFYNILIISHSFYWPAIELNQGIAIMIFYFAYLSKLKNNKTNTLHLLIVLVLVTTIIFAHPLIIIPFAFIILYLLLFNKSDINIHLLKWGIYFSIIALFVNKIFFKNWYDDMNTGRLKNFIDLFPDYFNIPANKDFIQYLIHDYYISGILFVILIIYLLFKKQYLKSLLILFFSFSYVFLVNISFFEGVQHFFAESKYMLLSIFISIPLVFDIIPKMKIKTILPIFFFIIVLRLLHINNVHCTYTARLDWMRKIIAKTEKLNNRKLILFQDEVPMDTLMMTWASSYEFWLLSSIENKEQRGILIDENPERFDSLLNINDIFLEEWRVYNYKDLPKRYFNFKDTTGYIKYHLE